MPKRQVINCTTGEVTEEDFTAEEIAQAEADVAAADLDFSAVRASRNGRLSGSDWTQGADTPLTDAKKAKWVTYRQELRDYPSTASKVSELPAWPTEPS
tara:strand:+ start:18097 stop:18393 length:297 start_codon:yes stop_codon:yes gene_type:complete